MKLPTLVFLGLFAGAVHPAETVKRDVADALRKTPDPANGEALFRQCTGCHGTDGGGQDNGNVPRIAGQYASVVIKQIVDFRHQRRWDFRMERTADHDHLEGPQDIADVAAYVSRLEATGPRDLGEGAATDAGASLFAARCARCHGKDGAGNEHDFVPRTAGQHYRYLLRQMYDSVDGRRPNFARAHDRDVEKLSYEELRAVSDYLSQLDWTRTR